MIEITTHKDRPGAFTASLREDGQYLLCAGGRTAEAAFRKVISRYLKQYKVQIDYTRTPDSAAAQKQS